MSALFKSVKAPVAPDPVATANAQGEWNRKAAISNAELNRADQSNPYGTLSWTQNGTNPDGTPKYVQNVGFSPTEQAKYDSTNKVATAMNTNAEKLAGNVDTSAWDLSKFTPWQTSASSTGKTQFGYDSGGNIQDTYASGGDVKRSIDDAGNIQDTYASGGDIQKNLDYSSLGKAPTNSDEYLAQGKKVGDAVYGQATSRLDPQYEAEARKYAATLAGKGVSENSPAYQRAMDDFARRKTDAYNQANFSAIQASGAEQSRIFGDVLKGRQQGVSEINDQGAFHNAAQGQGEMQNANRATFGNAAQSQRWGQNKDQATFGNAAQAQVEGQNKDRATFGNAAQDQRNTQNANAATFNNAAQAQDFGQSATNVGINNLARTGQVNEYAQGRDEGISRVGAALGAGGGGPSPLNFNDYAKTNEDTVDYTGNVNANYQRAMEKYTADKAAQSAAWGAVAGVAGSGVSAFAGKPKVAAK